MLAWTTKIYSKKTQIHGFIFKQDIKYRKYCKYKFNVIMIDDEGTSVRPFDASDCVDFVKLRICGERNLKVVADIGTLCCGFVAVFVYV